MLISHKYKFIFIKTRKTAGTSIEVYLSQFMGDDDIVTPISPSSERHTPKNYRGFFNPFGEPYRWGWSHMFQRFLKCECFFNHMSASQVKSRVAPEVWEEYFKFTVERNPWDKTLSHYHMINQRDFGGALELDAYLEAGSYCSDYSMYTDERSGELLVDRVLSFETLDHELGDVFQQLGIPYEGHLNVMEKSNYRTDKRNYHDIYTEAQIRRVGDIFRWEIEHFDYRY